jgi:hypothetical protein
MHKIVLVAIVFLSTHYFSLYAQNNGKKSNANDKTIETNSPKYKTTIPDNYDNVDLEYKIIASNASYIEIEYYPHYLESVNFEYNKEKYKSIIFENSVSESIDKSGTPDLSFRVFPLFLPSENNNSVTIIDYDINELNNINLVPIASVKAIEPSKRGFENYELAYIKNPGEYSKNKFLPSEISYLKNVGITREATSASLVIHPYQYNPVSKVLKQYTRIRVRVNFGQNPTFLNRLRSIQEYNFMKGLAINSDVAVNWINPRFLLKKNNIITSSKMSQGDWYKIEIKDNGSGGSEGIYKLSKSYLETAGINFANVDPRTIKMYGNGGLLIPEDPSFPRPQDLQEIGIYVEGEQDGRFDNGDYILFYANSINNWNYNNPLVGYSHFVNYYSKSNYYWIQINSSGTGQRMNNVQSVNEPNPIVVNSFTDHLFYEPEISNLIFEGNLWLSEKKSHGEYFTWGNTLYGLDPNSVINYKIKAACRVFIGYYSQMLLQEDNSNSGNYLFNMGQVSPVGFGDWVWVGDYNFSINASQMHSQSSTFRATFQTNQPDGEGYIDWMEIHYRRLLNSPQNDFLKIYAPESLGTFEYNVSGFSGNQIKIFDISNHNSVEIIQPISSGANSVRFQKTHFTQNYKKFIVTGSNGFKTPVTNSISQRIPNQDLHGFTDGADFIIITHSDFMPVAERIKTKREASGSSNPDFLKTIIVNVQQIYNEFSGGVFDATAIRDYVKYCYDSWQRKPIYVLLLGDGDFDYKNLLIDDGNWVPAWEFTSPTLNQVNGFTSDDYYVQISGISPYPLGSDPPDIAVGRIPIHSVEEGNNYLQKLDCYESSQYNGYWKNKMTFVADDGKTTSGNDGTQHTDQSEALSENFVPAVFDKAKLYLVAYPTVITSQGRRKPDCNKDIIKYWNNGNIMLNFVGHGSPEVWAHEYVFEIDVALSQLKNNCKYPFVTVASCDFSKFDNPISQSGGEKLLLAVDKGSIGTLAASRPVYGSQNSNFNNLFWSKLLATRDTLLLQKRFGDACFQTKQTFFSVNDNKFVLLSDPTLRVQIPRYGSVVDSIQGLLNDTMRALSRIKIFGSIIHTDSSLWTDFNGQIFLKLFDVSRNVVIRDEDGYEFRFKVQGGIIYSGNQSVNNGKWVAEFIVPKDISYQDKNGHLIDYFYNNQADGSGEYTNFIVGGIDPNASLDTAGPQIKMFLNDRNFRSGDIVNNNFDFISDLYDESGINTTGTIGHKLEATLDNNESNKYDLTTYYNSDTTYKQGSLKYTFSSVADGKHTLKLRVWDTYNNSSESSIDFIVSNNASLSVTNVINFPNPFKDKTTFTFQHNYPDVIKVKIKIYTVAGRLIRDITQENITDKFVAIDWNGKDEDGETLGNGVYIYRLTVESADGTSVTNSGKLAVLK